MQQGTFPYMGGTPTTIYITTVNIDGTEGSPSAFLYIPGTYTETFPLPPGVYRIPVYITTVNANGVEGPPSQTIYINTRPSPVPPPKPQQKTVCLDRYPLPNSSKRPSPRFNFREYWSFGASRGSNCQPR